MKNGSSKVPIPDKSTREPKYLRSVLLALTGREHLPPLGGVLRQRRHRRAAPERPLRPAGRQHPRRLAAAHRRPREPPRLRHVSGEPGSLRRRRNLSLTRCVTLVRQQLRWVAITHRSHDSPARPFTPGIAPSGPRAVWPPGGAAEHELLKHHFSVSVQIQTQNPSLQSFSP